MKMMNSVNVIRNVAFCVIRYKSLIFSNKVLQHLIYIVYYILYLYPDELGHFYIKPVPTSTMTSAHDEISHSENNCDSESDESTAG